MIRALETGTPLLESMARYLQCSYLSDLRFLSTEKRALLVRELARVQPEMVDLDQWNDALSYLTGDEQPREDAAEAKDALIAEVLALLDEDRSPQMA